jgi:xanthine dehydrogenase small subunit
MTGYLRPRSVDEAIAARAAHPDWMVLAGGTDLMVNAPRRAEPAGIIDLWRVPGLGGIARADGEIAIGAGTTYREIADHADVSTTLTPLALAAREVGALQIQARATIGGNIGTSSPVGDGLPPLLALAADELIVAVHIPVPAPGTLLRWRKIGTRRAQSISKVMGAAAIELADGFVRSARVALGAVADRPIRIAAIEAAVVGQPLGRAGDAARAALAGAITPITDVRSTAGYRLDVAANLVSRFFS